MTVAEPSDPFARKIDFPFDTFQFADLLYQLTRERKSLDKNWSQEMEDEYASITGRDAANVGPNNEVTILWYAPYQKSAIV